MKEKGIKKQKAGGSITVYLSLILLLILSLVFTIIEGARLNASRVYAERALSTAMDSVLAEYYGPLWEEYHIFAYDTGNGASSDRNKQIADKLTGYMSYTFDPNKGIEENGNKKGTDLLELSIDSVAVDEQTMLMDYNAQLLINEAVEYTKYREVGKGIELILDKCSLLEAPKKISMIYEQKQKAEEELAEIDVEILQLMKLFDGIKTGRRGIELNKEGNLQIEQYFIKKICFEEITKEAVGINQENVYQVLQNEFFNPTQSFDAINGNLALLDSCLSRMEQLEEEQELTATDLFKEKEKLKELTDTEGSATEDQAARDNLNEDKSAVNETIKSLEDKMKEISFELSEQQRTMDQLMSSIQSAEANLSKLVCEAINLIIEARGSVNQIVDKAEKAEPLIMKYEDILLREKENLKKDIYQNLENDLSELKRYTAQVEGKYDFPGMLNILDQDLLILIETQHNLSSGSGWLIREKLNHRNVQFSEESFDMAHSYIKTYQIKGLTLDYSTLVLEKADTPDPLTEMNKLLSTGIMAYILDPTLISEAALKDETLPSQIAAMDQSEASGLSSLSNFFRNASYGGSNTILGSLFGDFGDSADIASKMGEGVNLFSEHLLYQEYIKEHFVVFPMTKEDSSARKPSALNYEQEYLLAGKTSDKENITSVIQSILFLRTICNFVSILGDKDKVNEARTIASAMVGFTGLPILVSITQTLLLLLWSFAESLLDATAYMLGKEVPIIKKQVVMQFTDLFFINRAYLQGKASKIIDTKELSFGYKDYIYLFLLMKKKEDIAYRSLDLIQENIQLRYEASDFAVTNCLFGFRASASLRVKPKLTGISFVQDILGSRPGDFCFIKRAAHSY